MFGHTHYVSLMRAKGADDRGESVGPVSKALAA